MYIQWIIETIKTVTVEDGYAYHVISSFSLPSPRLLVRQTCVQPATIMQGALTILPWMGLIPWTYWHGWQKMHQAWEQIVFVFVIHFSWWTEVVAVWNVEESDILTFSSNYADPPTGAAGPRCGWGRRKKNHQVYSKVTCRCTRSRWPYPMNFVVTALVLFLVERYLPTWDWSRSSQSSHSMLLLYLMFVVPHISCKYLSVKIIHPKKNVFAAYCFPVVNLPCARQAIMPL